MLVTVQGLTGAIHETGHALYEQGRNLEYDGLPVNEVRIVKVAHKTAHINHAKAQACMSCRRCCRSAWWCESNVMAGM